MPPRCRHVILDRDGTLNAEAPGGYVLTPDQWAWLPGAREGLARLYAAGLRLSVATNQSCVGRGTVTAAALERIHDRMRAEARDAGAELAAVYHCPHAPDAGCDCRKPRPGLVARAVDESGIAAAETVFIGDAPVDLQAGQAAGVAAWLVRTGKGRDTEAALRRGAIRDVAPEAVTVVDDLSAAAGRLLAD